MVPGLLHDEATPGQGGGLPGSIGSASATPVGDSDDGAARCESSATVGASLPGLDGGTHGPGLCDIGCVGGRSSITGAPTKSGVEGAADTSELGCAMNELRLSCLNLLSVLPLLLCLFRFLEPLVPAAPAPTPGTGRLPQRSLRFWWPSSGKDAARVISHEPTTSTW
eukprot:3519643-Pyramimonas_sp.AAC.2